MRIKNFVNKNAAKEKPGISQVCQILFGLSDSKLWGLEKTIFLIDLTYITYRLHKMILMLN